MAALQASRCRRLTGSKARTSYVRSQAMQGSTSPSQSAQP